MLIWDARTRLSDAHDLGGFTCGEPAIDSWLTGTMHRQVQQGMCEVWVCPEPGTPRVMGFFTLTAHSIAEADLTKSQRGNQSGAMPALLLGQFAVRKDLQGSGLSKFLMIEAYAQSLEAGIGWRFLVLDALHDELVPYYEKLQFTRLAPTTRRMIMKRSKVETLLAASTPGAFSTSEDAQAS